jgi:hypothetical protein
MEWPKTEKEPTKYWLSILPEATAAKMRWRIEGDYPEPT